MDRQRRDVDRPGKGADLKVKGQGIEGGICGGIVVLYYKALGSCYRGH